MTLKELGLIKWSDVEFVTQEDETGVFITLVKVAGVNLFAGIGVNPQASVQSAAHGAVETVQQAFSSHMEKMFGGPEDDDDCECPDCSRHN